MVQDIGRIEMTIKQVFANNKFDGMRVPVKVWTTALERGATEQLVNVASMPFVFKHVAAMPDVHMGMGATIGSVIATRGAVIPAAVGVDIGCGMQAVETGLTAKDLPKNLGKLRWEIERVVPHGRTDNGGKNDVGAWSKIPNDVAEWWCKHESELLYVATRHPKLLSGHVNTYRHLGTLGTGNHFIEVCLDEQDRVWVVIHSGSRGIGNRIGSYFIKVAKERMKEWYISLPDKDLAYLPVGTQDCKDYLAMVEWAQTYAHANRIFMMRRVLDVLGEATSKELSHTPENTIDCHHNYITMENHFKSNVWVTRKGAIRARKGDKGIIPGSMGARSYIVEGLGNKDSFCSAALGAGRLMSRTRARAMFTEEDLIEQTKGVECKKDESVLDEIPSAYKDIDEVMDNQSDLVEIKHTLRQVINIKG